MIGKGDKIYQMSHNGIVITDANGIIQFTNPAVTTITGYSIREVVGKHMSLFFAEKHEFLFPVGFDQWKGTPRFRGRHGETLKVLLTISVVKNEEEEITNYLGVFSKQNVLNDHEEQLYLASAIFNNTVEGIMITDRSGRIQKINPAFETVTGYLAEDVIGKKPSILSSGRHDGEFYLHMWASIHETGRWQGEIWNRRKNGEIYLQWLTITAIKESTGQIRGYAGIFTDITEHKFFEERIAHQSGHDSLTGLQNRSLFHEQLTSVLDQAQHMNTWAALVFLDLDRFKSINDSLGHSVGDQILQAVSERLQSAVREGDTVARMGGDEFSILLSPIKNVEDAALKVRNIVQSFEQPLVVGNQEFFLTTSMGISLYPLDGNDPETLLKNADTAMYSAKEKGGNTYQFYTSDMNEKALERLVLESNLHKALERDEFLVYYQPKVDLKTNQIVGTEALIRWRHPELGMISPVDFIPLAEETGLIIPIGEWVLRTACKQNKAWQDAGYKPIQVAVNLSGRQFQQENLVETIARILEETGLDPQYLELEITENIAMSDGNRVIETLNELRCLGLTLSIDDFGTGYSSLSYLSRFPIDTLKIDRSFVRHVTTKDDHAAIVKAVISLAKGLNLKVIAEGVDEIEQVEFLKMLHCNEMQGYLFSPPIPSQALENYLLPNE
jgi:diguanylate cyclase (GGDEF)-like protein/PAS domain S-box-containing protein